MMWCCVAWRGTAWNGLLVWRDVVRRGVAWRGAAQRRAARHGTLLSVRAHVLCVCAHARVGEGRDAGQCGVA